MYYTTIRHGRKYTKSPYAAANPVCDYPLDTDIAAAVYYL